MQVPIPFLRPSCMQGAACKVLALSDPQVTTGKVHMGQDIA